MFSVSVLAAPVTHEDEGLTENTHWSSRPLSVLTDPENLRFNTAFKWFLYTSYGLGPIPPWRDLNSRDTVLIFGCVWTWSETCASAS